MIELDKMKTNVENSEKELRELIKEIGKYDDNFRSGKDLLTYFVFIYLFYSDWF